VEKWKSDNLLVRATGGDLTSASLGAISLASCEKNNMPKPLHAVLTRRERQIMDILFRRGRASAAEVMEELPGEPSYSTVRTQLRVLEEKGHTRHEEEGLRYVYMPALARTAARKSALRHLVDTFFDGSAENVVAALLGGEGARVSEEELQRIADLVAKARREGKS
jgi:BlaI family transcriptional regulator, penicillinase repressor